MAGSWPDMPNRRMAWHRDGTLLWWVDGSISGTTRENLQLENAAFFNSASRQELNDEDTVTVGGSFGGAGSAEKYYGFTFPEPRDITGIYYGYHRGGTTGGGIDTQFSTDSDSAIAVINTWTPSYISDEIDPYSVENSYRTLITTANHSQTGVRSIGILWSKGSVGDGSAIYCVHIYGQINASYTPDRLLYIDQDTGLEFDSVLDWGDVPRGVQLEHDIKVKNNSSTLTASSITLDFEALTGTSDTWHTIKETGGAFGNTLAITSISAGATYPSGANVITIHLTVSDTETFGPSAAYLFDTGTTWA